MSENSITRRQFITTAGAAALSLPFLRAGGALAAGERPNFVFILTDDQRHDAMSCAGHPFLRTPNIDRIAREGARFRNAFVTTALCSPSRASFLTGRYVHSHGVKDNKTPLPHDITTFPQVLQKAGYDTAYVGKWHMDGQEGPRPGFAHWVSFKGQGDYTNPRLNINGKVEQVSGYMTDLLTKHAVEWLERSRTTPFCLYLAHKAVHGPFKPAVRHQKLYEDVDIKRPKSGSDDLTGKPQWMRKRQETAHGRMEDDKFEQFVKNYNRTLVAVDEGVGRVLQTLEKTGQLDNTVIVFAGDNGYFQGEHNLLDKRAMYEESIRIPLVMRYPKLVRPGSLIDQMVLNIDICPTLLDIAGERSPEGVQGRSLVPLLSGKTRGWRSDFLYEYFEETPYVTPTIKGVRTQRWKYIEYPEVQETAELYDLETDPEELVNRIGDKWCSGVLADMRKRLERLEKET